MMLNAVEDRDLPTIVGWLNDKTLMRFSRQRHREHTVESQREYVASFKGTPHHYWAIRDGHELVGTATAYVEHGVADIGLLIGYPGHGYGLWAFQTIRDLMYGQKMRVTAGCDVDNQPMRRICEKAGLSVSSVTYSSGDVHL